MPVYGLAVDTEPATEFRLMRVNLSGLLVTMRFGGEQEAFRESGVSPERIALILEGGRDDTLRVAGGEAQAVLVLTSPRGPD